MPRERIYDDAGMFDLEIQWASGRYVQVGLETHSGEPITQAVNPAQAEASAQTQFTGLWGTFDRVALNRIIRILRRARDAAYGADE